MKEERLIPIAWANYQKLKLECPFFFEAILNIFIVYSSLCCDTLLKSRIAKTSLFLLDDYNKTWSFNSSEFLYFALMDDRYYLFTVYPLRLTHLKKRLFISFFVSIVSSFPFEKQTINKSSSFSSPSLYRFIRNKIFF